MDERSTDMLPRRSRPWGGMVVSDDDLVTSTLMFSGTYLSDDGELRILRSLNEAEYSAARFTGFCDVCVRAGLLAPSGETLTDVRAAVQFASAHNHADVD
jgi:hypothetical protein